MKFKNLFSLSILSASVYGCAGVLHKVPLNELNNTDDSSLDAKGTAVMIGDRHAH